MKNRFHNGNRMMHISFKKIFSGFLEYLKLKGRSPTTLAAYGEKVKRFLEEMTEQGITKIRELTEEHLRSYHLKMIEYKNEEGKGYSLSTLSLIIRALKRFFEYLEFKNEILINPAESLKEPKKEKTLPKDILTLEEAERLLTQPDLSSLNGIRDRAILETFYSSGIRLSEMAGLTVYDVDLQEGFLRIEKGKGAKDRMVPLGNKAIKMIKEYLRLVRPHFANDPHELAKNREMKPKDHDFSHSLFLSVVGTPLSKQSIAKMIRYYRGKAKISKKVSAHTFRHTFATHLIKNGADIRAVQEMLGHSSINSTQIYTRVAGVEIKKAHTKHHPREKEEEECIKPDPDNPKLWRKS